MIFTLIVIFA